MGVLRCGARQHVVVDGFDRFCRSSPVLQSSFVANSNPFTVRSRVLDIYAEGMIRVVKTDIPLEVRPVLNSHCMAILTEYPVNSSKVARNLHMDPSRRLIVGIDKRS